ncbi:C1 family peptidase [Streptomyces chattanoogensis]|uniref:C1 family peptidase n=1 Tax=Streptomyces chattanoogensis TaxID=66876 RepID=UPI00099D98D9|nr:C1 family peptidase [Streptomyces chattanoogensis]
MTHGSHRWKAMSGRLRTAIALASAGVVGAVTVGVSSAGTPTTPGHPAASARSSQIPSTVAGKPKRFGTGAVPSREDWRKAALGKALKPRLAALAPSATVGAKPSATQAALPASVDLSKYAPAPGNQGQVGSCAAWAVDYTAYGVLEREQKIAGGPQAPMFTYAQVVKGQQRGTSLADHFRIAMKQGVDAKSHYYQGDFDYTSQPTAGERRNAAKWKLSGYTPLHTGSQLKNDVKAALAKGLPVTVAMPVHNSFFNVTPQVAASYSYYPTAGDPMAGGHAMAIVGYTSKGVRVENSWGSGWGDHGFINLSWKFLTDQTWEANAVGKLIKR